jgi:PAX-interacting protein 1
MADFQSVKSYFENHNKSYFSFFPKHEKPIKAVIRHLCKTPLLKTSDGLVSLGFDVNNVKQMTTTRRSSTEESKVITLSLFLITLPRTPKSQDIFHLPSLCHIAIRVEVYRNQNSLTQCHSCQQFGHVWANCKQPPRCLWCGGEHLHKKCPKKGNTSSTPACCNCRLAEGEKPHPANYWGCRHAKEELLKKSQKAPKTTTGRVFSSAHTISGISFAAAL